MRRAPSARSVGQVQIETEAERLRRWRTGYVTERERRIVADIRQRERDGGMVSQTQIDYAATVETVLQRICEVH